MSRAVETRTEASLAAQDIARRACDMLSDGAAPASLSDQQVTRAIRVHAFRGWAAQQSPQLQQIVDTRLAVPELDTPLGGVVFTGQLGVLYEALLSLSLRRMTKGAIQLENRGWITREELEALPVAKRSRLLKTRAGSQVLRRLGDLESRDLWRRLQPHVTDRCMEDRWVVDDRGDRRSKGAHYTPSAIVEQVVERALGPLTCAANLADIPRFRIVDPACGAGVFLVAVAKFLAQHLEKSGSSLQLRDVAEQCLAAVDEDPLALTIAACELHAATGARAHRLKAQLHVGDAVLTRCNNSGGGAGNLSRERDIVHLERCLCRHLRGKRRV